MNISTEHKENIQRVWEAHFGERLSEGEFLSMVRFFEILKQPLPSEIKKQYESLPERQKDL